MDTQAQLREHKERAVAALSSGQLVEAAQEFSRAIYLDPRDVMLRQRLADLLARLGRKAEAVIQFQQVAGHYAAKGELLKAIAICRTILDLDPKHRETQETLAHLYARRSSGGAPKPATLPPSMSASAAASAKSGESSPEKSAPLDLHLRSLSGNRAKTPSSPGKPAAVATAAPAPASPPPAPIAELPEESPELLLDLTHAQRTPLFSVLDEDVFKAVIENLELKWVKAGEVIVREGDHGESMFVVVQGEMHVVRGAPEAGKPFQASLGEGSFFGEMALVARSPRLATVVAASDGLLFEIDRDALDSLALQHPGVERVVHDFYRERLLNNLLAVSPIFHAFSPDERRRIAARFTLRSLPAGAHILEQNREGAGLFCVLRGQCQPFHTTEDGVEHPYEPLREGDVFGEISLLFGTACTATVRTLTHVEVLELPAPAFRELVLPHKEVHEMIDRMARERLSRTTDLVMAQGEVMDSWLV